MWAFLPAALTVASSVMSAAGTYQAGTAAREAGRRKRQELDYEAAQLEQNAGQALAAAQRGALDQQRRAQLIASRALAVAAASGGGASDPTVVNTIARIAAEGSYRSSLDLYAGEEKARVMRQQAATSRYEGAVGESMSVYAKKSAAFGAATTLVGGGARAGMYGRGQSLFDRYGGGGPNSAGDIDLSGYA